MTEIKTETTQYDYIFIFGSRSIYNNTLSQLLQSIMIHKGIVKSEKDENIEKRFIVELNDDLQNGGELKKAINNMNLLLNESYKSLYIVLDIGDGEEHDSPIESDIISLRGKDIDIKSKEEIIEQMK